MLDVVGIFGNVRVVEEGFGDIRKAGRVGIGWEVLRVDACCS